MSCSASLTWRIIVTKRQKACPQSRFIFSFLPLTSTFPPTLKLDQIPEVKFPFISLMDFSKRLNINSVEAVTINRVKLGLVPYLIAEDIYF